MSRTLNPKPQTLNPKWLIGAIVQLSFVICCWSLITGYGLVAVAAAPSGPQIIINEIQYHPASDDHAEEYIELYNADSTEVDLSGWQFTDAILYTFPPGVSIPPGGYVVVGHDPATVEAVYGISGVLGPFTSGSLSNSGERVALEDGLSGLVDEVTYDDHRPWPKSPDGRGPSLELINPAFENDNPCSWGASQPTDTSLGTPGTQNSVYSPDNIPPCIIDVTHTPVFPTSSQPVTITAMVDDNSEVMAVTVHYRPEEATYYATLPMVDDGTGADPVAGDLLYTTVVPAYADGQYVEFYVTAIDDGGAEQLMPNGAPTFTSDETGLPVTISYLYQVEDTPPNSALPIYRLIMTGENWNELTTRDLFSDVLLDATFVYSQEVFYNVGVRYRGESTRNIWPRPYRIKFRDEHEFEDRERVNLVSDELGREALSHDLFQRVGLPAPNTRFVTFYINENRQGDYLDIEQVDNDFLEARFPDNDSGNLYRGFDGADLSYRGSDPDNYRPYYLKKNNEDADDYSDVIALTDALTNSPDETFRAEAEAVADMRQWLHWFAVQAVLNNHEGALWLGHGDDYFLYHRPSDDRFILISWDHDSTFVFPDQGIWLPNWYASEIVQRILNYPDFTRWYYQDIASIAANEFSVAEMYPRIDALPDVVSGDRNELKQYVTSRIPKLNAEIPSTRLSIGTNGGADFATPQRDITLEGECSPLRDVHVNGILERVQYPTATTWHYTSTLWTRDNVFVITDGLHTRRITVYWDTFHGGTLTEDTTLITSKYPYSINEDIVVPAGVTLTIEPGATLQFQTDRHLRVNEGGRLLAEGTSALPIVFTRQGDGYWGGILLDRTQADNRITHAVIEYTHEVIPTPPTHGISAYGARITVADSVIRHTSNSGGVRAYPWGGNGPTLYLLRNKITDIQGDAVRATSGYVLIQGNTIYDIGGISTTAGIVISDAISLATLLDNRIHDIPGDCLDLNRSSAVIERNYVHHCGDTGISIMHPTSTTLVNNLVYGCPGSEVDPYSGSGIAIKDGAVSHIMNNTVADNKYGIHLYEEHAGQGGGAATVVNSIVWGNEVDLELDAHSAITISYSDIYSRTGTGTAIWPGEGNINADPLFRAPQNGNYRLLEESPCVDTGTSAGAPDEDIRGVYRPHGDGYDRGAHEFFEFFSAYLPLALRSY